MSIPTGWELVLLLGVLVLLFGATKLPTAARSLGQSMRIFKAETKGLRSDDSAKRGAAEPAKPAVDQTPEQPADAEANREQPSLPASNANAAPPLEEPQRNQADSQS